MRSSRGLSSTDGRVNQVLIIGQSLGVAILNVKEALSFYLPGWNVYNAAVGSTLYTGLKKGTEPFNRSIAQGGSVILCIHGESDAAVPTNAAVYGQYVHDWHDDYAAALHNNNIKFLLDQVSSRAYDYPNNGTVFLSALAYDSQYHVGIDDPNDKIFLAGPKYQYAYETVASQPTGAPYVHMTADSYSWLGQKYAQIIGRLVNNGDWKPLYPTSITRSGAVITVNLNIPVPPLVLDTTTVSARDKYGFSFLDSNGSATVSSVSVGSSTITVTLTGTPTGTTKTLYYAFWPNHPTLSPLHDFGGSRSYAVGSMIAGNIRDSDTFSQYVPGTGPYNGGNWLTHFAIDIA